MDEPRTLTALDRILDPLIACLSLEGARDLLALRADPEVQARVAELAEKCNEGELTPEELNEYDTYVHASQFIAILSRQSTKASGAAFLLIDLATGRRVRLRAGNPHLLSLAVRCRSL